MRTFFILFLAVLVQGCTSKMAVQTLESTIEDAVIAAKKGSKGASKEITIEVKVTNGFKGSATAPIPVVPVGLEAKSETFTKLTLKVNLDEYPLPGDLSLSSKRPPAPKPKIFILDTKTGKLKEPEP
jgi:hypothetical protein